MDIERLGAKGDGIAADGTIVPYTLPGERAEIRREGQRAELVRIARAAPERVEPFCPYFMRCGGCRTQHLAREAELDWKRGIVAGALAQAGLPVEPEAAIDAHGEGRRRITLHVRHVEGRTEAGLMAARSHALVPLDHCPITVPALHRAPEVARAWPFPSAAGANPSMSRSPPPTRASMSTCAATGRSPRASGRPWSGSGENSASPAFPCTESG